MKDQDKKEYVAPQITTVSFVVEAGFNISDRIMNLRLFEDESSDNMEAYEERSGWHSGGDFWN